MNRVYPSRLWLVPAAIIGVVQVAHVAHATTLGVITYTSATRDVLVENSPAVGSPIVQHDQITDFGPLNKNLSLNVTDAATGLPTTIAASENSTLSSIGFVAGGSDHSVAPQTNSAAGTGEAAADFDLFFTVNKPTSYRLSASISVGARPNPTGVDSTYTQQARIHLNDSTSDLFDESLPDDTYAAQTFSFSTSGVLVPGTTYELFGLSQTDAKTLSPQDPNSTAPTGLLNTYNVDFSVVPLPPAAWAALPVLAAVMAGQMRKRRRA